jgi:hypothetical protein
LHGATAPTGAPVGAAGQIFTAEVVGRGDRGYCEGQPAMMSAKSVAAFVIILGIQDRCRAEELKFGWRVNKYFHVNLNGLNGL